MLTYRVKRRFFHKGIMQKIGDEIQLSESDYGRLGWLGYISEPLKKPRKSRKRRVKDGSNAN